MEYHYVKFYSDKEVTVFFEELNKKAYFPLHWNTQDGLKIYGCICAESVGSCLFPDFVIVSPKSLRQRVLLFSDVLPSALFGCKSPCSEVA